MKVLQTMINYNNVDIINSLLFNGTFTYGTFTTL